MKKSNKFLLSCLLGFLVLIMIGSLIMNWQNQKMFSHFAIAQISFNNIETKKPQPSSSNAQIAAFPFANFDSIKTKGDLEVTVQSGPNYQVKIDAQGQTAGPIYQVYKHDSTLYSESKNNLGWSTKITAHITMPAINAAEVTGNTKLHLIGFNGKLLTLYARGSSELDCQQNNFTQLQFGAAGASKINFQNNNFSQANMEFQGGSKLISSNTTIRDLTLDAQGASIINLPQSKTENANVNLLGASNLNINLNNGTLSGAAHGASHIVYSGSLKKEAVNTSGMSIVTRSE